MIGTKFTTFRVVVCSIGLITSALGVQAAPPATGVINPGKWQVTIHTTEPIDSPPMTNVTCVTPDAIAKLGPPATNAKDECVASAGVLTPSGILSYTINCPHLGRRTTVKITFAGNTYSGTMTMENSDHVVKQTIEGVRLGDCDAP
ncbi:MAG TPA: DUF3617 family protein [Thermoanaerobaculia bacterium]|jgi:hypothetical protein|nr:DUF3617 family protein [Thermoanaerobaculia bacterium]